MQVGTLVFVRGSSLYWIWRIESFSADQLVRLQCIDFLTGLPDRRVFAHCWENLESLRPLTHHEIDLYAQDGSLDSSLAEASLALVPRQPPQPSKEPLSDWINQLWRKDP